MAKFQVPTVGGIRKVIRPGAAVSNATTIAGLEGTTLTLAQLSTLLANLVPNTGGGNIGTGAEAAISVGPGLAGGGVLVGVVPIRLTAPVGLAGEDGPPGDDGVPGPAGKAGAPGATGGAGPPGPAVFFLADDGADGDLGPPGPPGPLGASGATGTTGSTGAQGPIGPGLFFLADDGQDGDNGPPGAAGVAGATGTTGSTGAQGPIGPGLFFLADDGQDGDLGPPGVPGPRGLPGPTSQCMMPEDANYDDQGFMPPTPVNFGPITANGILKLNGPSTVNYTTTMFISSSTVTDMSNGLQIKAGTSINDAPLVVQSAVGTNYFAMLGDSSFTFARPTSIVTLRMSASGNLSLTSPAAGVALNIQGATVTSALGVTGAIPAVTAGQTDLGTTTTATVITTAGGIALPALASTFWVVNVNGVKYGIPCFAL